MISRNLSIGYYGPCLIADSRAFLQRESSKDLANAFFYSHLETMPTSLQKYLRIIYHYQLQARSYQNILNYSIKTENSNMEDINVCHQTSNSRILENSPVRKKPKDMEPDTINRTEECLFQNIQKFNQAHASVIKQIKSDYNPAVFQSALQYKLQRSYCIKAENGTYRKIGLLQETKVLKYFGLGPYFYVEFMRRICWLFFCLSLLEGVRVLLNCKSSGLSDYSASFSTFLIPTTLGNYNKKTISNYDTYIVALVPALSLLILLLFYLCWKSHFFSEIDKQEENHRNIKPQKFCVEVVSRDEGHEMSQNSLRKVAQNFGPVHEVSLVTVYKDKLGFFEQLQQIEQKIKQNELQQILGEGNPEQLSCYRSDKKNMMQTLRQMQIEPRVKSAYIHFQYEKSKVNMLTYFNDRYLFSTCCHGFMRNCCCCCLPQLKQQFKLNNKYDLLIKEDQVPAPEDINWQSIQISSCSKFMRIILASFVILVFLAISCTIIGICTIYVSTSSSDCDSITIPNTMAAVQAANDQQIKKCYCNSNVLESLTNSYIKDYCSSQLQTIYIEQGVQYVIILTSAFTNFLFGLIVQKIVKFTRPISESQGLKIKTLVFTIFLIFNSVFLPILLYSDIFGFRSASYFSFITLMFAGLNSFLNVENLQFYLDYNPIWYRNVSPMFTNFIILDFLIIWLMFAIEKFRASYRSLGEKESKILQRHMNEEIISYQFSPYKQYSAFNMILFMSIFLSPGIPVLIPLGLLNLVSRYITNRSLIQQNSTRVNGLGVLFNQLPHSLMPILLILTALNGCWMLTANTQIYPKILPFNIELWSINKWSVMQRQLYLPFYFFLALLSALQYLFYQTFVRFISCASSSCFDRKRTIHPSQAKTFTEYKKSMNILTSYNIKRNDKMRNAVTRMQTYIRNRRK